MTASPDHPVGTPTTSRGPDVSGGDPAVPAARAVPGGPVTGPPGAAVPTVGREAVPAAGRDAVPLSGEAASLVAAELVRRADADRESTRAAGAAPTAERRRSVARCRRDNAEALAAIVRLHGWPTVEAVGGAASTAALMILLHAPDLGFRLRCRDLIAQATADGRCPAVHLAYIADHCAVELGEPQFYGTRINPVTLRPYPVRRPQTLDERRRDVGLGPLEEQMRALRAHG
ncbi:DUF6624 domain-containing protein [Streptomyces sp. HYC2]|uniref:DUF6624 domain-containing protein n=1 Tax=Streptomyces sp. HYC2 TaxID=2955207 RepID=UPI00248191FF|nr:DUF6624 domain-containing protein [Streptomyces sp. HYC2]